MLGEAPGTSRYFARIRRSGAVARAMGSAAPAFDCGGGRWPGLAVHALLFAAQAAVAAGQRVAGSLWWKEGAMQ